MPDDPWDTVAGPRSRIDSKRRLGHASVGITLDIYSHVVPAMREDAAAAVATLIFPTGR